MPLKKPSASAPAPAPTLSAVEQRVKGWVKLPPNDAVIQLRLSLINPDFPTLRETFEALAKLYDNPGQTFVPFAKFIHELQEKCPQKDIPALNGIVCNAFSQTVLPNWWNGARYVLHLPLAPASSGAGKKTNQMNGQTDISAYVMPSALQTIESMLETKFLGLNDRLKIYSFMLQWVDLPNISQELRLVLLHRLFTAAGYLNSNGKLATPTKPPVCEGSVFALREHPLPTSANKNPTSTTHVCVTNDGEPSVVINRVLTDPQAGKKVIVLLDGKTFADLSTPPQTGESPIYAQFRAQRLQALRGGRRTLSIMSPISALAAQAKP